MYIYTCNIYIYIYIYRLHCCGCNCNISIRAKHTDEFISASCLPPEYTISHAVGTLHTHHSHRVVLYGGIYIYIYIYIHIYIYIYREMSTKCGATGSRKPLKLCNKCIRPTSHGDLNIKAYSEGKSPVGFPGWAYKSVHLMENVIINNIQHEVDQIQRASSHQDENPDSSSESENMEEDQTGLLHMMSHTRVPQILILIKSHLFLGSQ